MAEGHDFPQPQPRLYWEILIPVAVLVLCAAYGLYALFILQVKAMVTPPKVEAPIEALAQPEDVRPRNFTHYGRKEAPELTTPQEGTGQASTPATPPIPQAQYVKKEAAPTQDTTKEAALVAAMQTQSSMVDKLIATITSQQAAQQAQPTPVPAKQIQAAPVQPKTPAETKTKTPIKFLIDNSAGTKAEKKDEADAQKDSLLEPAHWIRPFDKTRVLYRSQVLPGRLLTSLNSDTPGVVHVELTIPIYSKQARPGDAPLMDKLTVIICKYQGEIKFGQTRVPIQVEEAQPPNGDMIELKAIGGDEEGRAGVTGTVNNHYGKLFMATGINAVLQLGVKGLAGTPGQGQYFQNPVQSAAQEAGQSAANDIGNVVKQQLKVPPTIEKDRNKDPFVTILLEKNLSFYRSPKIVK
jgi:type IV secretory pathway VirB10-like protein